MSIPYSFNPLGSNFSSGSSGMYLDGTALKGRLCNPQVATTVGDGADGSTLTDGTNMFYECPNLTSWTVDLPNLTNGYYMFCSCYGLTSFTGDLPNLENGDSMFVWCEEMTSWTVELPNLTNGNEMFFGCTGLTSFNAGTEGLKSLTKGDCMFQNCILNETSVLHILNTIPTYTSGTHKLHLGDNRNFLTSTDIASLLGTTTPIAAGTYNYKGWTITVQA